ncbi:hypothetical protein LH128_10921 [Sphingomonas sp. LH128]|uniref:hypothetical protein n=1 Tax=Sphingomonas sp. LH128 TaxID=473781 RepID=UPI00027CC792|nr:hypothetical protein [Sphingomonas sp. LH128]EJU12971.1 hypothetical protein LH128_10921 [Sphingomonas sp. LH128]
MNRFAFASSALALIAVPALGETPMPQRVPIDVGQGGERVAQTIVYGDDPCPVSASGEITVCARKPEEERYRIPEVLRDADRPPVDSWTNKVRDYQDDAGLGGCSVAGRFGALGCWRQFVDRAFRERKDGAEGRYAQLIQAEREKRLAGIDAEAKAEQTRVEEIERAYFERQERQSASGDAVEQMQGAVDATAQE